MWRVLAVGFLVIGFHWWKFEGADRDDLAFLVGILSLGENTLLSADEKPQNKLEKTAFGFWLKF